MAERVENGILKTSQEMADKAKAKGNGMRELFENTQTHRGMPESVWPKRGDLNPESKHDESKNKKFMLSGEPMTNRLQTLQEMPPASYGLPDGTSSDGDFDYQKEMQNLDKLSSELDSVRQQLMADILRCQLLQVDLATQFNPALVQQLRSTKLSCEKCEQTVADSVDAEMNP